MGAAMHMAEALGYDVAAVADLLPEAESGVLEGIARMRTAAEKDS